MPAGYTIHATQKLLDRVRHPVGPPVEDPRPMLGNWYATAWFWKPQLALFVNERTLLPVVVPLAPAATLSERFPDELRATLEALGTPAGFVEREVADTRDAGYAKTSNRSVVGIMNEFGFLAEAHRDHGEPSDPVSIALWLAHTPCGPLYKSHSFPDKELAALVAELGFGA